MGVPEESRLASTFRGLADAHAGSGVEVMGFRAILRFAEAVAIFGVEVPSSWALALGADALATCCVRRCIKQDPLPASTAVLRLADTGAGSLIPYLQWVITSLNDTVTLTLVHVPGLVVCAVLRRANALTPSVIPDCVNRAVITPWDALTFAGVKVPEVVVVARTLDAAAFTGKCVELLILIFALSHFVPARAVAVLVTTCAVHELAGAAGDYIPVRLAVVSSARQQVAWHNGHVVLGLYFCKIHRAHLILSFKG